MQYRSPFLWNGMSQFHKGDQKHLCVLFSQVEQHSSVMDKLSQEYEINRTQSSLGSQASVVSFDLDNNIKVCVLLGMNAYLRLRSPRQMSTVRHYINPGFAGNLQKILTAKWYRTHISFKIQCGSPTDLLYFIHLKSMTIMQHDDLSESVIILVLHIDDVKASLCTLLLSSRKRGNSLWFKSRALSLAHASICSRTDWQK